MTNPRPGDVGLTNIAGPAGLAVRIGQVLNGDGFSRYEHAYVVVAVEDREVTVVEAMPGGAILGIYEDGYRKSLFWSPRGLTDKQRDRIVTAAYGYIGVPYSFADFAAIAAHRLGIPAPGLRKYIASSGHMICSAMADKCYQDAGVQLFNDGRWNGYVTPGDLYELTQVVQR